MAGSGNEPEWSAQRPCRAPAERNLIDGVVTSPDDGRGDVYMREIREAEALDSVAEHRAKRSCRAGNLERALPVGEHVVRQRRGMAPVRGSE